ncbi:MAG TPA: GDSL-type esterase/lipase family protein [Albitalea sp.]|uniref:GDSL-type esterase/lipase family protein n=1 Tax=Piscinibacter sp. TaxID=1903157 RepID=UPI002ED11759
MTFFNTQDLVLYDGRPHAGLRVQVAAPPGQQDLVAGTAVEVRAKPGAADNLAGVRVSGKDGTGDALTMHWKNTWFASLRLVADKPMDLRPWLPDGTLEFEVNALDMAKAGLTFAMGCGKDCGRKVSYVVPSRALHGKGWQHLSIPLQCFARNGNDFSAVTQPFVVDSSSSGEVAVADMKIVAHGKPTMGCGDYRTESVTPEPLSEVWALDWWMPRHEQKLQEIRKLKAAGLQPQVVLIGDSITQGWEDNGRPVWDQYFRKFNALDLGFSGDRTENVLWRLQHGEVDGIAPKVAVLMVGTNNTGHRQEDPRTTAAGIRRIVEELRQRLPGTKVLVLAIFPREEQPDTLLRTINNEINALISGMDDGRRVFFLDINKALMNPDGTLSKEVLPDLLHLSEKGYRIWARNMDPTLQKLLAP